MGDRLAVERKAVPWPVGNDELAVDEFGRFVRRRLTPQEEQQAAARRFAQLPGTAPQPAEPAEDAVRAAERAAKKQAAAFFAELPEPAPDRGGPNLGDALFYPERSLTR